jgi:hypothetical protein
MFLDGTGFRVGFVMSFFVSIFGVAFVSVLTSGFVSALVKKQLGNFQSNF